MYRRVISYAVRLWEYIRFLGKLKHAMRSITGSHVESIPLEEIVARQHWAVPPPRQGTTVLSNPHKTPEEAKDMIDIHKVVSLEGILPSDPSGALYST